MTDRSYKGDPIDMTWNDPPWNETGETVEVVTDGDGKITTEGIDDAAEELSNYDLGRAIRAMRRDGINYKEIQEELAVTAPTVADAIYGRNNFEMFKELDESEHLSRKRPSGTDKSRSELDIADVVEYRTRVLNGETVGDIHASDDCNVSKKTLREYIKGRKTIDPDDPPALEYDHTIGWHNPDNLQEKDRHVPTEVTPKKVSEFRKRVLSGESPQDLSRELDLSARSITRYIKGNTTTDPDEPPALTFAKGVGWHIPHDDTDEPDDGDTPEADSTDRMVGMARPPTSTSSPPRQPETRDTPDLRSVLAVVGVVALVHWVWSHLHGGDDA